MRKAAFVQLTPEQRAELTDRLERESLNGRRRRHLQILLLADEGRTDGEIVAATGASRSTVERHRTRFAREGLEAALADKPRSGAPAKLDGKQQAAIVALACSDAPEGQARWTARLLANRVVELEVIESISESSVRRILVAVMDVDLGWLRSCADQSIAGQSAPNLGVRCLRPQPSIGDL